MPRCCFHDIFPVLVFQIQNPLLKIQLYPGFPRIFAKSEHACWWVLYQVTQVRFRNELACVGFITGIPWSSGSVKNWLSYDLKLIWATYLQNWCHRSANMAKKCENTRSLMICRYFGFFLPYLNSCDINFEDRCPKLILNHNSVNS